MKDKLMAAGISADDADKIVEFDNQLKAGVDFGTLMKIVTFLQLRGPQFAQIVVQVLPYLTQAWEMVKELVAIFQPTVAGTRPVGGIKKCTKGHSWSVPWGPDLNSIGFADINGGVEVCSRCLVEMAIAQNCGTVQ